MERCFAYSLDGIHHSNERIRNLFNNGINMEFIVLMLSMLVVFLSASVKELIEISKKQKDVNRLIINGNDLRDKIEKNRKEQIKILIETIRAMEEKFSRISVSHHSRLKKLEGDEIKIEETEKII